MPRNKDLKRLVRARMSKTGRILYSRPRQGPREIQLPHDDALRATVAATTSAPPRPTTPRSPATATR